MMNKQLQAKIRVKFLGYLFLLAALFPLFSLYPFPSELMMKPSTQSFSLELVKEFLNSLWLSWFLNLAIVISSLIAGILSVQNSKHWKVAIVTASILFIAIWWIYSGLYSGDSSFLIQVWRRWIIWPFLNLKFEGGFAFLKIIVNDYFLFGLYHFTFVYFCFERLYNLKNK